MTNADIIETGRKRLAEGIEADRANREEAFDDMRNLAGDQWASDVREARETAGRPCLTVNRLPQFVRQVTGDIRNMNPAIKVMPADERTDEAVAELVEALVRQIQYDSDASSVYESAAENAACCGMGFFRILPDYVNDSTFDQEIRIKWIPNPFAVIFDPMAADPTRCDARWCFITERMSAEDFEAAYPGKSRVEVEHDGKLNGMAAWMESGEMVVAEYFWKEETKRTLYLYEGGFVTERPIKGVRESARREVKSDKVMWAKMSGKDILEGPKEFPCKYIPVVAVMGEELVLNGRTYRSSVIRHAKDSQRMYNYWRTAQTELIALQPKAPWLVTPKHVAGLDTHWINANNTNAAYLPYNPDDKAPPPSRQMPPQPSAGMTQEVALAADDMKATTGIFDAGLGNRSNEQSGVAIRQRQMESDVSTSIYADNLGKAVAQAGRIIVALIPKIYDTARAIRVVGDDDAAALVPVNQPMTTEAGPVMVNDLTSGNFSVRVAVGPNYTTRRQESAQSMMEFVQAFPMAAQVSGDIIAKAMDWPGAEQMADRLKKMLPPGMDDSPEAQQSQGQAQQAQMEQMQMARELEHLQLEEQRAKTAQSQANAAKAEAEARKAAMELAGYPAMQPGTFPTI